MRNNDIDEKEQVWRHWGYFWLFLDLLWWTLKTNGFYLTILIQKS